MAKDIKKIIAQEYIKCAKDPAYFMKKYCHIQHPTRGRILFNLYPFQSEVLHLFRDQQYIITLKSRQLGISTLAAAYSLWLMLFHKDKNVLALATTQATARNLVTKTMFMYDELPKWLKLPAVEKNKLSLRLKNGSKITAKSSNADAARSEAVSLLLIDEAAFIDNIAETFTAAQQTLATGGQCMALSTPNGIGNWFHQTWDKAEAGDNSFLPIRLPWTVHPERNEEWLEPKYAQNYAKRLLFLLNHSRYKIVAYRLASIHHLTQWFDHRNCLIKYFFQDRERYLSQRPWPLCLVRKLSDFRLGRLQ